MSALLTPQAIADQLSVSLSLIQKMIRASEYAAEIRSGKRLHEDVPAGLVGYLDCGFPIPKRIGKCVRRLRRDDLDSWLNQQ